MVKLFLNQIGMTVFGTMLALALSRNASMLLASGVFSIVFFLALNYSALWEIGAKDKIRIDGGRLKPMPGKGAVIAAGANLPNVLLTLLMGLGVLIGTRASESMSIICNAVLRLLNGMYLGVLKFFEYTFYVSPEINSAIRALTAPGANAQTAEVLEILNGAHPGNSVEPISRAMEQLGGLTAAHPEAAEAYTYLETAFSSPTISDIWWWFLVITVPSIAVGALAYYLGSKNIKIFGFLGKKSK